MCIALSVEGKRMLNGDYTLTAQSTFEAAGTIWIYKSDKDEILTSPGPLTQEVALEVLIAATGTSTNIVIEYFKKTNI